MRWISLVPLIILLSGCIYTEGTFITEPEDVVVSPKVYQLTPWYPCQSTNVSQAKCTKKCSQK
jgi:hypothetical protein